MSAGGQAPRRAYPLEPSLRELFSGAAAVARLGGDDFSAQVIETRTPDLARAWGKLASQDKNVDRFLRALMEGSTWGEVIMVTLSVLIPILWHRGLIPDQYGVPMAAMVVPESEEVRAAAMAHAPPPPPEPEPGEPPAAEGPGTPGPAAMSEKPGDEPAAP